MKLTKKRLVSSVAASVLASGAIAPAAYGEVSASVGIANMYYWRGLDLGNGDAAVSGDVSYSAGGFYTGIWGSSGDAGAGTEYDLFIGYGGEVAGFAYDFSLWSYNYPSALAYDLDDNGDLVLDSQGLPRFVNGSPGIGDLMEFVVGLGYGPLELTYYHGLEDLEDYWYTTLGATFGNFSVLAGLHEDDLAHIDFSYFYNENLTFTLGQVVDDADGAYDDDLKFIVSYSIPLM